MNRGSDSPLQVVPTVISLFWMACRVAKLEQAAERLVREEGEGGDGNERLDARRCDAGTMQFCF